MCFEITNGRNIYFFFPSITIFLFWTLAKYQTRNGFTHRNLLVNGNALDLLDVLKEDSDLNGSVRLIRASLVIQNYCKVLKYHRLNVRDHSWAMLA